MSDVPPDELRRRIDEALTEIDEVEAQVLELFSDVGGPDAKAKVLAYIERATRAVPLGPSRRPPATP